MERLLEKYGKLSPLSEDEQAIFENLSAVRREFPSGVRLVASELDEPDQLFIVESGRLFASIDLPGGGTAITRLYFAGDIVGTANMPFERATQSITVASDAVLHVFPRRNLAAAFAALPRIAAIFYTFAALENAILNDRLVSIGRTRGIQRLASLILEVASRRNLAIENPQYVFKLGLTQAQIGDAIGLTAIQVNRLFRELDGEGVIKREQGYIEVVDLPRLAEMGNFRDRYEDLDLDWFTDLPPLVQSPAGQCRAERTQTETI